ncbi:hypothetical protein [Variovorax sp. N23]|uniref:hypothetical protein n=1 Tax=Variovorax sp. N23 TaxID=2980555 RepID=UPI0021CAA1DA|nr:hypothetical protein [Variovorax sp. N23]MCU4119286.1 hypothetical protein [Variovorax sp. N23]
MIRWAVIKDGIVVNVILWDGADASFADQLEGAALQELPDDSPVGPGWTYVEGEFVSPPAVEPPVMPG